MVLVRVFGGYLEGETSRDFARGMDDSAYLVVFIFSVDDKGGPYLWQCILLDVCRLGRL